MKTQSTSTPSTSKVRRDVVGGKRGDGDKRVLPVRRPDPGRIGVGRTDETLTSVAGLVAFGKFMREQGIDRDLRALFGRLKSSAMVIYPMEHQLRLMMDALVVGETRVFGIEALAADPLFVRLAGGVVPSIDTVYRDLCRFDDDALVDLEALMAREGLDRQRLRRHREVHLDIDTTVTPLFGEHEGAGIGPNPRYHARPSYHPIVSRIAETDTCVGAVLRPGDTAFGENDVPRVQACVRRVCNALTPRQTLYVRMDAAADCSALLQALENEGVRYVVKARMSDDLAWAVTETARWRTVDWDAFGRPVTQVADVEFDRLQWMTSGLNVRVVALRTLDPVSGRQLPLWEGLDWSVKVFLSNAPDAPEDIAARYEGRAGIEPLIGEWKHGWGLGEAPCWSFHANHAVLLLKLLVHNLVRAFVRATCPLLNRWRIRWLRRALFRCVGRLTRSGRSWTLRVAPRSALLRLLN